VRDKLLEIGFSDISIKIALEPPWSTDGHLRNGTGETEADGDRVPANATAARSLTVLELPAAVPVLRLSQYDPAK